MSIMSIDRYYSFEVYGDTFINSVDNGILTDIVSGITAEKLGFNVATIHEQIYQHLPEGTVENFKNQKYYIMTFGNGQSSAYGESWIKQNTIRATTDRRVIVTFPSLSDEQQALLPGILDANNFKYTLTVSEV